MIGAPFWITATLLLVLAAELLAVLAARAARARLRYHTRRLKAAEECLLAVEAELWILRDEL